MDIELDNEPFVTPTPTNTGARPPVSPPAGCSAPELLAPAGDFECIRAAIENGADAVYFGLDCGFNARARAANFPVQDLTKIVSLLHRRGVKGYVTLNTLVFTDELPAVEQLIREIAFAGVDAVLVQDLGLVRLIRAICPALSIHASTQMTLTSAECIREIEELGVERVVLARELSVDEIRSIRQRTRMPLEVFVHGALCVAYSGQCLTSESLGGRSANRGQCAQACRLPYELVCDGQDVELGAVKYLLSPQDLAAYALTPDLIAAGVCSFKIEGRLKTAEYVANITRHYRQAIDTAMQGLKVQLAPEQVRDMEMSFSRGFSPGWLHGCDHKMLVPGLSSAKRGVRMGTVRGVVGDRVRVELEAPVMAGDGIVFDDDRSAGNEQGGRIYSVWSNRQRCQEVVSSGTVELELARGTLDVSRLCIGQIIWKTDDPRLTAKLRRTFAGPDPIRRVPLDLQVDAVAGERLRIRGWAESGAQFDIESEQTLAVATKHPVTQQVLETQLGRLGGSNYLLRKLEATIVDQPMVPLSVLGELRRQMIAKLDESINRKSRAIAAGPVLPALKAILASRTSQSTNSSLGELHEGASKVSHPSPVLHVLCRSMEQLRRLCELGARRLMVDFQDIREYRDAVGEARNVGAEILLATPRIQKPGEMGILTAMAKCDADAFLVRNLAGLAFCRANQISCVADFSLNAANELTAQLLIELGATRLTPSFDLNREQLLELVDSVPATWLEVVIHQRMPLFHMEHCVFCAVLSPGTNKTNCGRPCDVHRVQLRDRIGVEHPLTADVGCRNTLFNAVPQSGSEAVPSLLDRGVRQFRIEFLDEDKSQMELVMKAYQDLLMGRASGRDVWRKLNAANRVGVTRGTFEERRNPLAIL